MDTCLPAQLSLASYISPTNPVLSMCLRWGSLPTYQEGGLVNYAWPIRALKPPSPGTVIDKDKHMTQRQANRSLP